MVRRSRPLNRTRLDEPPADSAYSYLDLEKEAVAMASARPSHQHAVAPLRVDLVGWPASKVPEAERGGVRSEVASVAQSEIRDRLVPGPSLARDLSGHTARSHTGTPASTRPGLGSPRPTGEALPGALLCNESDRADRHQDGDVQQN